MQELRKVKENIHPDSLDEFSVASHYVPKDVSEIPDEDRLSEVEIRMATVGKSFEDALNGFLINRESVYLDDDQDAEPKSTTQTVNVQPLTMELLTANDYFGAAHITRAWCWCETLLPVLPLG